MAHYTQFHLSVRLRDEYDHQRGMWEYQMYLLLNKSLSVPPDHPFFACDYWQHINGVDVGEGYLCPNCAKLDHTGLTLTCRVKNYTNEIGQFLHWIEPYVESVNGEESFAGYIIADTDNRLRCITFSNRDGFKVAP